MKVKSRKPPKGYNNPLEASYGHLLETPFHGLLLKDLDYQSPSRTSEFARRVIRTRFPWD
jgi:hypothetical protein